MERYIGLDAHASSCTTVKLHARRGVPERQGLGSQRGGNERASADRGAAAAHGAVPCLGRAGNAASGKRQAGRLTLAEHLRIRALETVERRLGSVQAAGPAEPVDDAWA